MSSAMSTVVVVVTFVATTLSVTTFSLNLYLLLSIFLFKTIQRKVDMTLIYSRFLIDTLYGFANTINLSYILVRAFFPDAVIKNLSFFTAWPTFNLGSTRCFLVLFITSDRVFACCAPIFYHRHRSKVSNLVLFPIIFSYSAFEYYILFGICGYVLDVPLSCISFTCSVSPCYRSYWINFEQIGYFTIGVLSLIICFRLFIWNYFSKGQPKKEISRTTRLSLLDTCFIFIFDVLPSFLYANFPQINFQTVGPLTSVCKNSGFVIETSIICNILIGKKPTVVMSSSRISPMF
ncbi:hypothetical protein CAEBREN_19296 [Caenorhabditis brenneri]|uniref:Uncharacterized protein n=1 Tax=Caenorhabditis brenneri TaxID=135651 RepID=G0NEF5_CAEBE|nr:hypothetical protein CAEBREN_19296 [Caenorhabditis brenneri]